MSRDIGAALLQGGHHEVQHLLFKVKPYLRVKRTVTHQQRRQELADGRASGAQANVPRNPQSQV